MGLSTGPDRDAACGGRRVSAETRVCYCNRPCVNMFSS